jgi:hypothetical protein
MSGRRKANSKYGVGKLRPVTAVTRGATSQFLRTGVYKVYSSSGVEVEVHHLRTRGRSLRLAGEWGVQSSNPALGVFVFLPARCAV